MNFFRISIFKINTLIIFKILKFYNLLFKQNFQGICLKNSDNIYCAVKYFLKVCKVYMMI